MVRDLLKNKIREFLLKNYTSSDFCSCDEGDLLNQYEHGVSYVSCELADYILSEFEVKYKGKNKGKSAQEVDE